MEKKLQNPGVVFALALLCCALWGSAFPCVKIGYEWLAIEGAGSQILFAGYRFFLAGIFTFLIGSFLEKRWLMIRRSSVLPVFGQGMLQTFIQYICFYIGLAHTTGAKGSVINASNAFFALIFAHFMIKSEKMTWKKSIGCLIGFAGVIVINLTPGGMAGGFQWMGEGLILMHSSSIIQTPCPCYAWRCSEPVLSIQLVCATPTRPVYLNSSPSLACPGTAFLTRFRASTTWPGY